IKLTDEPWPRLSLVRQVANDQADYLGPFSRRRSAEDAVAALHAVFSIRQCTGRLPVRPSRTACALAEMGTCLSPCDGSAPVAAYAAEDSRVREALPGDPRTGTEPTMEKMRALSQDERYAHARVHRDRLAGFLHASARMQRISALTRCHEVVAAARTDDGWEVHVIRFGRLVAADVMPSGADARHWVRTLRATAETVTPGYGPTPCTSAAETELVLGWLESDGVRLVHVDGAWVCPTAGASRHLRLVEEARDSRTSTVPFDERGGPSRRPVPGLLGNP